MDTVDKEILALRPHDFQVLYDHSFDLYLWVDGVLSDILITEERPEEQWKIAKLLSDLRIRYVSLGRK